MNQRVGSLTFSENLELICLALDKVVTSWHQKEWQMTIAFHIFVKHKN